MHYITHIIKKERTEIINSLFLNKGAGNELSSQAVARQVFSPR